ncbi:MAG: pantetheine-phosphate adenylyltransferase [Bacteroidales bacterium]|nr:pantetheine-phosphate adenylyltransferase [Bacteroidales bacterium]
MNRIAVFPGSFDPMTKGHLALLKKATLLFDKIIVAIGINTGKKCFLPIDERKERIINAVKGMPSVEVTTYDCLTTDLCHNIGAGFILRGIRDNSDFEYERKIADINRIIAPDIETVLLFAEPEMATISSTMVRELAAFGKDISEFIV